MREQVQQLQDDGQAAIANLDPAGDLQMITLLNRIDTAIIKIAETK